MNKDPTLYDSEDLKHYGATAPTPRPQQAGTSDSLALGSTADYYEGIASPSGYYDDHGALELEGSQAQSGMAPHVGGSSAAVTLPAELVLQDDGTYLGPRGGRYTLMNAVHEGHAVFSYQTARETRYMSFSGNKQINITSAQAGVPLNRTRVCAPETTWSNTLQPAGSAGEEVAPARRSKRSRDKHTQTSGQEFIHYRPSSDHVENPAPKQDTFTEIKWAAPRSYDPNAGHSGSSAPTADAYAKISYAQPYGRQYGEASRAPQPHAASENVASNFPQASWQQPSYDPGYSAGYAPTYGDPAQASWQQPYYNPGYSAGYALTYGDPAQSSYAQSSTTGYQAQYGESAAAPQRRTDHSRAVAHATGQPQQRTPRTSHYPSNSGQGHQMTPHQGRGR